MNPVEKNIIDAFKLLVEKKLSIHRIELFGSRARGDAYPDSDMDVLVIVDDISPELEDYIRRRGQVFVWLLNGIEA